MVVKVGFFGRVLVADVDDEGGRIFEVGVGRIASLNFETVFGDEYAASEEVVFVGAARMSEDEVGHVRFGTGRRIEEKAILFIWWVGWDGREKAQEGRGD